MRTFLSVLWLLVGPLVVQAQTLQEPSDVRNVEATALSGAVRLTWNPATDDGIVTSYKIHYGVSSVTQAGDNYDNEIDIQTDETTYEISNLINNDTYFFAVTAVDDQGLESKLYSVEVSATPTSGDGNGSPYIKSASHTAPNKILVIMSEPIEIDDITGAFELTEDFSGTPVTVLNTLINSQQATLVIDSSALVQGNAYRVTATTGVTDLDGNPVSSGLIDSVEFTAESDFEDDTPPPPPEPEESEEEILEEPEDEPLIDESLSPDDVSSFFLDDTRENSDTADFLDGLLTPDNPINNLDPVVEEPLVVPEVQDEKPATEPLSSAPDKSPPQDARSLSADTSSMNSGSVMVSWIPALDIEGDIKDQVLYTRVGLGAWDAGTSLGKDVGQSTIDVVPNQNYQVRLVTIDNAGNESFGAAFEFSTTLNQSGGGQGSVIALSVLAVLGFFFLFAGGRRA